MAKRTLTLHPAYATPNTVCFKEDGADAPVAKTTAFRSAPKKAETFLGSFYLTEDQCIELGWQPTEVGDEYETAPDRRGKTYTRANILGPDIKVTIEVA